MTADTLSKKFDVVAVYDIEEGKPQKLIDYITALHMMREGQRDRFFMTDMLEVLEDSYAAQAKGPLEYLTGTSKYGLRMSLVQATHEGVPTFLPVIEDMKSGKMLVVGPQGVGGADTWPELTYVNAELYNRDNAIRQINDFLVDGARDRGYKGELLPSEVQDVTENMVKAALILATPRGVVKQGNIVDANTTLGQCFALVAGGEADAAAYVVARDNTPEPESGPIKVRAPLSLKRKS